MTGVNTLFCDSQCQLGEGPLWVQAHGRLYWFDILNRQLQHCAADGSDYQRVQLDEYFSAAALLDSGELLLASETGLWRYHPTQGLQDKLIELEADNPLTRSNDGRADRQGGFWIGTMGKQAEPGAGAIYRYYRGELRKVRSQVSIPNALCFSPDGRTGYFADSLLGQIFHWPLDAEGWPLGEPSVLVDLSGSGIDPDGAVVDSAGYLWNAQWNGARVVRYAPNGQVDKVVELPVSRPTCPVFAGDTLERLLVTSARDGLSAAEIEQEPWAGGVLEWGVEVIGLADGVVWL